jgi:TPP-dependent pyruvate/acetoin dehydrogenase alpha subunit
MQVTNELMREMFRRILRIRHFEDVAIDQGQKGVVPGALHTSHGQEGEIVGACMALRLDDYMIGNHRSHGHPIAKGAKLPGLMAELLGKKTGVNQGKGGSMHLADFSVGSLGETSIVGSGIPVAAGAALGAKMMGTGRICLCFFGDGATNEGAFHEGLNLAAVWKLPAVFLCENNLYGMTTPASEVVPITDIADRAKSYGFPGIVVDGQDVVAVYEVVREAVERARSGGGPSLIEAKTYRYKEHAAGLGRDFAYRTQDEIARWQTRDPLVLMRARLSKSGIASERELMAIEGEVVGEVADALEYAKSSPFPPPEDAFVHMYSNPL